MRGGFAERITWAAGQLAECRLCPRDCRVDRTRGERGWCGAGAEARFFAEFVHYGEEAELVPSHMVYLTGCNLGCLFCGTAGDRARTNGQPLTASRLRTIVERGRREGARNLNLLGGEPMANLPALLRLFAESEELPPIVWNTNLYCTAETLETVSGIPAVYLVDLKFGNAACAARLCGAEDYWDVLRARLAELWPREGRRLIVRHLVLPGHVECCTRPALEWLAGELGRVRVSLMTNYLVMPAARREPELGRFLGKDEAARAEAIAAALDIERVQRADPERALEAMLSPSANPPAAGPEEPLNVEVVISPRGEVYLRQPTRAVAAAALAATRAAGGDRP